MIISASVGEHAANKRVDVKTVQILLNLNARDLIPFATIAVDGKCGLGMISAIKEYQRRRNKTVNGRIEAADPVLDLLRQGLDGTASESVIAAIMVNASSAHTSRYAPHLQGAMDRYQINTPIRRAHFLAQLGHESGEFRYAEELANGKAYEGRIDLGNTHKGDGVKFKGRGLIQITGRKNYTDYGVYRHVDYTLPENTTLLATDAPTAVDSACWFWMSRCLNLLADADDFVHITRRINGGTNGIEDRRRILGRAKWMLKAS